MDYKKNYLLDFTAFFGGAVLMIFEIVGSRILAPYLGTSIYVWTSLIGVILAGLSIGCWYGGIIADKKPQIKILSVVILLAGICIGLNYFIKDILLNFFQKFSFRIEVSSLIVSIILFCPAAFFLGMVTPYCVKLKTQSVEKVATIVGRLYALSSLGSILGTFFAGFIIIPFLGTNKIILSLAVFLIILSFLLNIKKFAIVSSIFIILFSTFLVLDNAIVNYMFTKFSFVDADTEYNRFFIYKDRDFKTGKKMLDLFSFAIQSSVFIDSDELVYDYLKFYKLAFYFKPELKNTLMIGGGAYTVAKDYLKSSSDLLVDVVEIDSGVTKLAKKYFNFKEDARMHIVHEDGRAFINKTNNKYDFIFEDVYNAAPAIPFQLATIEAVKKKFELLTDGGVLMTNVTSSFYSNSGRFLRAEYATYKSIFKQVFVFPVYNFDPQNIQNIMLVGVKSDRKFDFISTDNQMSRFLGQLWKKDIPLDVAVLTDNYAPVEFYEYNKYNKFKKRFKYIPWIEYLKNKVFV